MKTRPVLPLLTLTLLALVLGDKVARVYRESRAAPPAEQVVESRSAASAVTPSARVRKPASTEPAGTPTLDRLARLAARRQISREGATTFLDSLLVTTDSVVRRWPDREGAPLRVAILEGGAPGYDARMAEFVRRALASWEEAGLGLRFTLVSDSTQADIAVHWIDRFSYDRAGQTDLTWDQLGHVRRASIALAVRTSGGVVLPDLALLSVALHETGHALGLPHSADSTDVMFPATRTGALSERDRRTAVLLYRLPPGPVRDGS